MRLQSQLLLAYASAATALCPMAELTKRGLAPPELAARYAAGQGIGEPGLDKVARQENAPPILDPISGILSPEGLGSFVPRSEEHKRMIEEHVRSRNEERDEDVNINAPILTPKAHKRYVEERDLVGSVLRPLTGILSALDIPTPQESGLQEIPGDDPDHQYQPPGPTDIRGDCPTLNTLANHGYLSRNGITSFAQAANAIQIAYSMSFDIAVFLSALGLLAGGDIPTGIYTIGGEDPRVPSTLGTPLGIDRHGLFEIDASVNRGDRYYGDNHSFNITRWNNLVTLANDKGDGLFNLEVMAENAAQSVEESRANNPEFAMGANFGVIYATRALLTRPLPNGTDPNFPNFANIAPFYLNETFPCNWYRIPNSYSLVDLANDIGALFLYKPQPLGANVNGTFVPLDIQLGTAPKDVGCAALELLAAGAPNEVGEPAVQAAAEVYNQIIAPVLGGTCDITDYIVPANASYTVPGEYINGGSGSGITHPGEWDSQTVKPTGQSAGDEYYNDCEEDGGSDGSYPSDGSEPTTTYPSHGSEPTTTYPSEGSEPTTTYPSDGSEPTTTYPSDGSKPTSYPSRRR